MWVCEAQRHRRRTHPLAMAPTKTATECDSGRVGKNLDSRTVGASADNAVAHQLTSVISSCESVLIPSCPGHGIPCCSSIHIEHRTRYPPLFLSTKVSQPVTHLSTVTEPTSRPITRYQKIERVTYSA